jgi:hypothetical protein
LRFAAERFPEIQAGVDQVEKSLQDDERARRRQSEVAEAIETRAKVRELEDERDQIVAVLSGAPGASMPVAPVDRVPLRTPLGELTAELEAHQQRPDDAVLTTPGGDDFAAAEERTP